MSKTQPARGSDQFPLRLPDGMRDRVKASAERNGRSMNTEIIMALDAAFPEMDGTTIELQAMIKAYEAVSQACRFASRYTVDDLVALTKAAKASG